MTATVTSAATVVAPTASVRRRRGTRWTALQLTGLAMVATVVLFTALYPLLPQFDPYGQELASKLLQPGSADHPLGTDALGRDTASRLALAGRVTLAIVLGIIVANCLIGIVVGMTAGYLGGRADNVLMGVADIQLALPVMLVLIALAAVFAPSVWLMVGVLAATYWVGYARVARSVAMGLAGRDFVLAPKILGARVTWILRKHVLPGVATQVLIIATTDLGAVILLTASFDYLGLGVQAPVPSWGSMVGDGQAYLRQAPWVVLVPGICIFLMVTGANLISQRFTHESTPLRRRKARS
ncbi:ABC transporter permease [Cellulomonas xiejunii]|uniref:ABC transporter permease n=1 Tax=Cellulomonas xiejunii TaxID=2968083 RepID=A0ABY5KYW8_9CELL|nr:ABC transporter permease [Cellulomonas xiejunii]MCC2323042.1 ABC transporter permease [Cellulomonas xiejunii]UUI73538.1 ABC transporter permease [Cellulomonas xiejunii]